MKKPQERQLPGNQVTEKLIYKVIISPDWRIMQQILTEPKMPPLAALNSLELVDEELKVFSALADDVPEWIKADFLRDTRYDDIHQLTFFYHPGADAVILSRSHRNADFYELLVTTYLETTDEKRQRLKKQIPENIIGTAIDLLDFIIEKRSAHGRA